MTTPVKFELAKLLKEKGFDKKVRSMYCEEKLHKDTNSKGNYNDVVWVRTWRSSPNDDTVSAPTIAEVVMWLYEKHGIWIIAVPQGLSTTWVFSLFNTKPEKGRIIFDSPNFNSPTETYEAAIEYCLTKLI